MFSKNSGRIILIGLALLVVVVYYCQSHLTVNEIEETTENKPPDAKVKSVFENIYDKRLWGVAGDGSGPGSAIAYATNARNILYSIIKKYGFKSLLDAPCGSFLWMEHLMKNVSKEIPGFKYHGLDIVGPVIGNLTLKFAELRPQWTFTQLDFTEQQLPDGYDLIFSRDSVQHLPLLKAIQFLEAVSKASSGKFLLVQSYVDVQTSNRNIEAGGYYQVNLFNEPFNLKENVEIYSENDKDGKCLILYDIEKHMRSVNFDQMRERAKNVL
jgi:hypothetical protein